MNSFETPEQRLRKIQEELDSAKAEQIRVDAKTEADGGFSSADGEPLTPTADEKGDAGDAARAETAENAAFEPRQEQRFASPGS